MNCGDLAPRRSDARKQSRRLRLKAVKAQQDGGHERYGHERQQQPQPDGHDPIKRREGKHQHEQQRGQDHTLRPQRAQGPALTAHHQRDFLRNLRSHARRGLVHQPMSTTSRPLT